MRNLAAPAWLFAVGILAVSPAALAAQNDTGQPVGQEDNTSYGTTSAEFLLLGAGARGTALGGSFAAIATDISSLYYNPAGAALIEKAGLTLGTYDYVADTRYSWGGLAFPFSGGGAGRSASSWAPSASGTSRSSPRTSRTGPGPPTR